MSLKVGLFDLGPSSPVSSTMEQSDLPEQLLMLSPLKFSKLTRKILLNLKAVLADVSKARITNYLILP